MLTGDVIVFENDIRLIAVAECLHIFLRYLRKRFIREFLVQMWIERAMEHRLLRSAFLRYQSLHVSQYILHRVTPLLVLIQLSDKKDARFSFPYLLEVVTQCSSEVLRG